MRTAEEMRKSADVSCNDMMEDATAWAEYIIEETISPTVEESAHKGCYSVFMEFEVSKMDKFQETALREILLNLGYEVNFNSISNNIKISW